MIGFMGCGNMAKAIISGILLKGIASPDEIIAYAPSESTKHIIKEELKINLASCNKEVAKESDIIIFGIKPQMMDGVIAEIKDCDLNNKVIVSLAPGKTFEWFYEKFEKKVKIVRTAPNTPATVLEGMTSLTKGDNVSDEEFDLVRQIFNSFGKTAEVPEKLLDVALALSGASPAFVFMFIEALADGAVAEGMPRKTAYTLAAQAVLGSAKMVLETDKLPAMLKDEVASPAGTTIEGINTLEDKGFRAAVMDAVRACVEKSKKV